MNGQSDPSRTQWILFDTVRQRTFSCAPGVGAATNRLAVVGTHHLLAGTDGKGKARAGLLNGGVIGEERILALIGKAVNGNVLFFDGLQDLRTSAGGGQGGFS